eukprot:gene2499-2846_t
MDAQVQAIRDLGIGWLRADIHFDVLEPTKGQMQWTAFDPAMDRLKGFNSIVYLAGTPRWASSYDSGNKSLPFTDAYPPQDPNVYASRIVMLAKRYPWVTRWEIWNEQNIYPHFWAPDYDPVGYAKLYTACLAYPGLNSSILAVGGMAYYGNVPGDRNMLKDLATLGTLRGQTISYHPYTEFPEGGPTQAPDDPYAYLATVKYLNNLARTQAGAVSVWATEWGWSSENGTIAMQADYTVKRLLLDTLAKYNHTFIFTISDLDDRSSSTRDKFYGLVDLKLQKKPVYHALANLFRVTGLSVSPVPVIPVTLFNSPKDFVGVVLGTTRQTVILSFWSPSTNVSNFQVTIDLSKITNLASKINTNNQTGVIVHNPLTGQSTTHSITVTQTKKINLSTPLTTLVQIIEWPVYIDPIPTQSPSSTPSSTTSSTTGETPTQPSTTATTSSTTTSSTTTTYSNSPAKSTSWTLFVVMMIIGLTILL